METSIELLKLSSYKFPSIIYYPFPNKSNFLENPAYLEKAMVRSKIDQLLFPIILDHLLVCIVC